MPNSETNGICPCTTQQYDTIVFNNTSYQNSADFVYEALKVKKAAATSGTLGAGAAGTPMFKTDYERMQYLLGSQKRASCGVPKKSFAFDY